MIDSSLLSSNDIDVNQGLLLCGSEAMYLELTRDFYREIDKKATLIETMERSEDVKEYTVAVHSLKSSAKLIGATRLSDMALEMEMNGHKNDLRSIHEGTSMLVAYYRSFLHTLAPLFPEQSGEKRKAGAGELIDLCNNIISALDNFDIDAAAVLTETLRTLELPPKLQEPFDHLIELVDDIEYDKAADMALSLIASLQAM